MDGAPPPAQLGAIQKPGAELDLWALGWLLGTPKNGWALLVSLEANLNMLPQTGILLCSPSCSIRGWKPGGAVPEFAGNWLIALRVGWAGLGWVVACSCCPTNLVGWLVGWLVGQFAGVLV